MPGLSNRHNSHGRHRGFTRRCDHAFRGEAKDRMRRLADLRERRRACARRETAIRAERQQLECELLNEQIAAESFAQFPPWDPRSTVEKSRLRRLLIELNASMTMVRPARPR